MLFGRKPGWVGALFSTHPLVPTCKIAGQTGRSSRLVEMPAAGQALGRRGPAHCAFTLRLLEGGFAALESSVIRLGCGSVWIAVATGAAHGSAGVSFRGLFRPVLHGPLLPPLPLRLCYCYNGHAFRTRGDRLPFLEGRRSASTGHAQGGVAWAARRWWTFTSTIPPSR
jgi:hypothetical protein